MNLKKQSFEGMIKRMVIAPAARKEAASQAALAVLDGKPEDALLYTGAQFARLLNVSTMTLWRLRKKDELKIVKVLGSTRYRRSDLLRLAGEVAP